MNRTMKILLIKVCIFLVMLGTPVLLTAGAPQTDAEIQNYSKENITIEYRIVTIGGKVQWKPIGKISKGTARIFRNLTIGSVIRAKGDRVTQEFTISSPPGGGSQLVLKVK